MNALAALRDFFAWLGEVFAALGAQRAPGRALGVEAGEAVLLSREPDGYRVARPARAGDAAPLRLTDDQVLALCFDVAVETALYGRGAARLEAAKRCPFPLEEALWAVAPAPEAWRAGAPWRFVAAPRRRVEALRDDLRAVGARPGRAFALNEGAPMALERRRSANALTLSATFAGAAILSALALVPLGAARIESAAEARLTAARSALDAAESEATEAAGRRDEAAAPLRAARAGAAILAAAPPAGDALAALAAATPDAAHARRLTIGPRAIEGEFLAPDAAALAARLAESRAFSSARLLGAARADPASGLQRAVLEITPEAARAGPE